METHLDTGSTMNVFIARQAILNRKKQVSAYELFFREGQVNAYPENTNHHVATSKLIGRTYFNKGIKPFTSGKRALINFSEESLLKRLPFLLPKDEILIEILEDVEPSDKVFSVCQELVKSGYSIALDDFVYKPEWKRFLTVVRVIKFDIQQTSLDEIEPLISELLAKTRIKLLAEKVETHAEYKQAVELGFHLFQGYYFCKPEMKQSQEIESTQMLLVMLLNEVKKKNINYSKIIGLLEKDCGLVYKMLCYVNSGIFPLKGKITSVKQAITYMGELQLKELISLFFTAVLAQDKPPELIQICATRAKFCELVINNLAPAICDQAFMTGMFSLIDAILDIPMRNITTRLSLDEIICETLLDEEDISQTPISMALRTIRHLENGRWHLSEREALKLRIPIETINQYYQQAIEWAEHLEDCDTP